MNKTELITLIADQAGITKTQAGTALNTVTSAITETLQHGKSVSLIGFGTFHVKQRQARSGRNPRTGETIQIAAANIPSFKPGKALKQTCN